MSGPTPCSDRGPGRWGNASSCRRPSSAMRSISTAMAGATSGVTAPTSWGRSPTTCPGSAGAAMKGGGVRSWYRAISTRDSPGSTAGARSPTGHGSACGRPAAPRLAAASRKPRWFCPMATGARGCSSTTISAPSSGGITRITSLPPSATSPTASIAARRDRAVEMGATLDARILLIILAIGFLVAGCASSGPQSGDNHHRRFRVGQPNYTVAAYQVNGVWYHPRADYNYDETGTASWYGPRFDGHATSDGEIYDMNQLSAAHKTLPLPSVVQVTNLQNGRALQLRVNDRGAFVDGRLIDLSRRAAQLLGLEGVGTAPVRVRIIEDERIQGADAAIRGE